MITNFKIFEFNKHDKYLIYKNSDNFTFAIEYEICSTESNDIEPEIDDIYDTIDYIKDITLLSFKRGYGMKININNYTNFIDNIFNKILSYYDNDKEDKLWNSILNSKKYENNDKKFIIDIISHNVIKYIESQNIHYSIDMLKKHLPNFYKKWGKTFKYELEGDNDKTRILEFSPRTYIKGINNIIEQLNDFYKDFNKQKYWIFNDRTALHINIGIINGNLNIIKGLMLLSDYNRDIKTPYIFKNIENRLGNIHNKSMIDTLINVFKNDITDNLNNLRNLKNINKYKDEIKNINLHNIEDIENQMNNLFYNMNFDFWIKEFGLNITQIKNNYVEFRYVGNNVKKDILIEKLEFFTYIVYCMNTNYKQKEYHKKLYKFINKLNIQENINWDEEWDELELDQDVKNKIEI